MEGKNLMEKIINFVGRIIFGKVYYDGFANNQNKKKEIYVLTSVFPNEKIKNEVHAILREQNR